MIDKDLTRPVNLTKEERAYYNEFDKTESFKRPDMVILRRKCKLNSKVREAYRQERNALQKDIFTRGVPSSADHLDDLDVDHVNSHKYTASDYMSNPYSINEDILIDAIDKQREEKSYRQEEEKRLRELYTGSKLTSKLSNLNFKSLK